MMSHECSFFCTSFVSQSQIFKLGSPYHGESWICPIVTPLNGWLACAGSFLQMSAVHSFTHLSLCDTVKGGDGYSDAWKYSSMVTKGRGVQGARKIIAMG